MYIVLGSSTNYLIGREFGFFNTALRPSIWGFRLCHHFSNSLKYKIDFLTYDKYESEGFSSLSNIGYKVMPMIYFDNRRIIHKRRVFDVHF